MISGSADTLRSNAGQRADNLVLAVTDMKTDIVRAMLLHGVAPSSPSHNEREAEFLRQIAPADPALERERRKNPRPILISG